MTEETATANTTGTEQQQQQKFELQKVYLKDVSLETPNSPGIFAEKWSPKFNLQINAGSKSMAENVYEVVLTVTVTAKLGEKTAYLAELQQAGLFGLNGFGQDQLGQMLGTYCPNTLFPYAREAIDTMLVKGGFPPLHLSPVNFDVLYLQHVKAQKERQQASETTHATTHATTH